MDNFEQKAIHDTPSSPQQSLSKKFDAFVSAHPDWAINLELPDELLDVLVPNKVREVASNLINLEVSRFGGDSDKLSIIVVEHNYSEHKMPG